MVGAAQHQLLRARCKFASKHALVPERSCHGQRPCTKMQESEHVYIKGMIGDVVKVPAENWFVGMLFFANANNSQGSHLPFIQLMRCWPEHHLALTLST